MTDLAGFGNFGAEVDRIDEAMLLNNDRELLQLEGELTEIREDLQREPHYCLDYKINKFNQSVYCTECSAEYGAFDVQLGRYLWQLSKSGHQNILPTKF